MQAANLRRRYNKVEASALREENRRTAETMDNYEATKKAGVPPPPTLRRPGASSGRMYTLFSAFAIAILVTLLRKPSNAPLPESWALCSRPGSTSVIYTVDENQPTVECIVVHQGRVIDSGSITDVRKKWGDKDTTGPPTVGSIKSPRLTTTGLKVKYLRHGEAAYPGFTDAHSHILHYGAFKELDLAGTSSSAEVVSQVRSYVLSRPYLLNDTSIWIEGQGWNVNDFPGRQYPTADELDADEVLRGRPILLATKDVHAYWTSNKVIEILGDLPDTVEGGVIVRDENGKPTGIFVDDASNLIMAKKPAWTQRQLYQFFQTTMTDALAVGLTSLHDAASYPFAIDFYKKMADRGLLPIRVNLMAHIDSSDYWGDQFEKVIGYANDRLNVQSVKLFMDGALGTWGAALIEPYTDRPDVRGNSKLGPDEIKDRVKRYIKAGWQVNVHCIGDRANHDALDAFEEALSLHTDGFQPDQPQLSDTIRPTLLNKGRHRIEHAQHLTQDDIKRFGKLGLIASMQPTHATSDMYYAEDRLGPERIKGSYAWRSLLNNSVPLAIGSDFPVEHVNPLYGFYAAITRLDPSGNSPHGKGGWYPEQVLTRQEALNGMTLGAAYAGFQENIVGSLVPGKRADIVILQNDIMVMPIAEILGTKVRATIVEGALMYGKV